MDINIQINQSVEELVYKALFSNPDEKKQAIAFLYFLASKNLFDAKLLEQISKASEKLYIYTNHYTKIKFLEKDFPELFNFLKNFSDIKVYKLISNVKIKIYRKNLDAFVLDFEKPYIIKLSGDKLLSKAKIKMIAKLYNFELNDNEIEMFINLLLQKIEAGEFEHSIFENEKQELQYKLFINLLAYNLKIIEIEGLEELKNLMSKGVFIENYAFLIGNKLYININLLRQNNINLQALFYALQFANIKKNSETIEIIIPIASQIVRKVKLHFWIFDLNQLLSITNLTKDKLNIIQVKELYKEIEAQIKEREDISYGT